MWIIFLVLSALFSAMDQITRFPEKFLPISRLNKKLYIWSTSIKFPFPVDAKHFYQGAKIWALALGWFLSPDISIWLWLVIMLAWWVVLRNFLLHTVLTNDDRTFYNKVKGNKL